MYRKLAERADELQAGMVLCRRDLHKYAETGWLEMRTSAIVGKKLAGLGYRVLMGRDVCLDEARMGVPPQEVLDAHYEWALEHGAEEAFLKETRDGFTGVIGILSCGEGPVIGMRFDMDALGVSEEKSGAHRPAREAFASVADGMMHACGHDGHTAIGLGVAEALSEIKEHLHGTVKLIFQPAEEGVRGAKSIVEHGHLDDVDYLMGGHLSASQDGHCYVCPGMAGTLATTKLDAYLTGKSAHAGFCPQNGRNALLAAAAAVMNLQAIPRHGSGSSLVNVGTLHAGSGRNVVCEHAVLELEVRGETTEINEYMENYALRILEHAAAMHGCTLTVKRMGAAAAMECTPEFTGYICSVCRDKMGLEVREAADMGGSEDFAYMTKRVIDRGGQACFTGITVPTAAGFHNGRFDFDERALAMGVKLYTGVVYALLRDERQ